MDFRLLIARRYLVSRRRVSLVSIISGVSVAGVALGVTALIVVLSVLNGFYGVVRDLLASFDPHVRIEAVGARGIEEADSLIALAERIEGVTSATPFVEGKALLAVADARGAEAGQVVLVRGVDPAALAGVENVTAATRYGTFSLEREGPEAGIVMGEALGIRLGVYPEEGDQPGSTVTVLSASALEQTILQPIGLPARQAYTVRGLYELQPAYDQNNVFVALEEAQRLFRMPGRVSGIDLRLADLDDAERVQLALQGRLSKDEFTVRTWYNLQQSLYDVMRLEKWAASAILILIVIVAAFNIVGSVTMIVIEKRRDLAVLRAMGATQQDVRRIFLLEGLLVGLVGTGIGLVLGLGLALLQQQFGLVPLDEGGAFIISAYPVDIQLLDVALVSVVAVGLCVLAALYPSARAAAVEPARAIQAGS